MGRANSVEFFDFEAEKCACSLFSPGNTCCRDTHELLVIDDFQVASSGFVPDIPEFYVLNELNLYPERDFKFAKAIINTCFSEYSPPPIPLYKVNCSFVFYDDPYAGALLAC